MMNSKRLANEIAIVTGSDSGIGQAIAIAFAKEGADVAVTYFRDRHGAENTVQQIRDAGQRAALIHLDQRDADNVRQLFDEVEQQLGVSGILVNNASVNFSGTPVAEMPLEEWDNVLKTDLYGPFFCCRQFIQRRSGKAGHGCIINITSVHQEIPRAGAAAYDAAKGGVRNLTTTLALELGEHNINVNNIAPGMVLTPMNQQAMDDPGVLQRQVQSIPMKRAGQPEEIASAAVFLASSDARYIHGATLVIDGALMLYQGQGA
jgi:glucose 1-dehydrogenase